MPQVVSQKLGNVWRFVVFISEQDVDVHDSENTCCSSVFFPSSEGQSAMRIVLEEREPTQANQCDHTPVEIGDFTPRPN